MTVRDKEPVCVKCGAKLTATSTCEFEPSISHAQCCGLSYTIGEPSTDTAAADQECACDNCNICVEQLREEVRRLREELIQAQYIINAGSYGKLEAENKRLKRERGNGVLVPESKLKEMQAENKRLREALQWIADTVIPTPIEQRNDRSYLLMMIDDVLVPKARDALKARGGE